MFNLSPRLATAGRISFLATAALLAGVAGAAAKPLAVVATIAPLHGLASAVMAGAGTPELLIRPGTSPHGFIPRPSDIRKLANADLVIWLGPNLETGLAKAVTTLSTGLTASVMDFEGLHLLPTDRDADEDPAHDEDEDDERHTGAGHHDDDRLDHDKDHHAENKQAGKHDDDHDDDKDDDHGHGHGHDHGEWDPHVWLDSQNAAVIAARLGEMLGRLDPDRASVYAANVDRLVVRMQAMTGDFAARLRPYRREPYAVYHDAYRYFEQRFGLMPPLILAAVPGTPPSLARMLALRRAARTDSAFCAFREPQFAARSLAAAAEGASLQIAVLDPLGVDIAPGPESWFTLMENMAQAFIGCFSGKPE